MSEVKVLLTHSPSGTLVLPDSRESTWANTGKRRRFIEPDRLRPHPAQTLRMVANAHPWTSWTDV